MRAGSPIFSYQNYMTLYTKLSDALQPEHSLLSSPQAAPERKQKMFFSNKKSPHGGFRKGLFFMEPAKRLELLAC